MFKSKSSAAAAASAVRKDISQYDIINTHIMISFVYVLGKKKTFVALHTNGVEKAPKGCLSISV
jgi:hypothetical protein